MTADLSGKLPRGTQKIRLTTNLQIYWDNILISRTPQASTSGSTPRLTSVPLIHADLEFHGYPYKIEGIPPGNVRYVYEKTSATGPYTRPKGTYTRYGDVLPLLTATDDRLAVFGSATRSGSTSILQNFQRCRQGGCATTSSPPTVTKKIWTSTPPKATTSLPLPFLSMGEYPYSTKKYFPLDDAHVNYLLEYNTRHMSGNEQRDTGSITARAASHENTGTDPGCPARAAGDRQRSAESF